MGAASTADAASMAAEALGPLVDAGSTDAAASLAVVQDADRLAASVAALAFALEVDSTAVEDSTVVAAFMGVAATVVDIGNFRRN